MQAFMREREKERVTMQWAGVTGWGAALELAIEVALLSDNREWVTGAV